MSRHQSELTDAQWVHIAPLLPEPKASPKGGPQPIPNRPVFEGVLWVLRSGAPGKIFPNDIPPLVLAGDDCETGKCRISG